MSHTILIDESNGNGLFAMKNSVATTASTATTTASNNSVLASSVSNEDLSQSLSEYTDADESMSAPTEFLAEFLSAVMLKDYKKALKYCKLILQYEPNNVTAKEFYPLILEKLKDESSSESDENYNKSSSSPDNLDIASEPNEVEIEISEPSLNIESDSEEGNCNSSSSVSESDENNLLEASNSNVSSSSSSSGGSGATGGSDNTTHSYSSLLLEEDDDASPPPPLQPQILSISSSYKEQHPSPDLDLSNGNIKSTSCSDSESPTEPLTQRLVAILRSKCVPSNST